MNWNSSVSLHTPPAAVFAATTNVTVKLLVPQILMTCCAVPNITPLGCTCVVGNEPRMFRGAFALTKISAVLTVKLVFPVLLTLNLKRAVTLQSA